MRGAIAAGSRSRPEVRSPASRPSAVFGRAILYTRSIQHMIMIVSTIIAIVIIIVMIMIISVIMTTVMKIVFRMTIIINDNTIVILCNCGAI